MTTTTTITITAPVDVPADDFWPPHPIADAEIAYTNREREQKAADAARVVREIEAAWAAREAERTGTGWGPVDGLAPLRVVRRTRHRGTSAQRAAARLIGATK